MANIISAITNNVIPGPKGFGTSKLFVLKLDADPSISGCTADTGTLALFNGTAYVKTGSGDTDWSSIATSYEVDTSILSNLATSLEGAVYVDISNSAGNYVGASGIFDYNDAVQVTSDAVTTGFSSAYGAPYLVISEGLFTPASVQTGNGDLRVYPNACPVFSATIQVGNNVTVGTAGFNESSNKLAFFSIGTPASAVTPGLSLSYGNGGSKVDLILDENYTNYQNIHNFQIHFETNGSMSYYIYDLGDGTGDTRATRNLVTSGNISNSNVPSGSNFLQTAGVTGTSVGGSSSLRLFYYKLLLRHP